MKLLNRDASAQRAHGGKCAGASCSSRTRLGAAFSLVVAGLLVAGLLVAGLCGGSFSSLTALAVEGGAAGGVGAATASVNATPKDEVVYARLSASGTVDNVYVVNVLKPAAPGAVTDFGPYDSVENLTDTSGVRQAGDAVSVQVAGDSLSYQGNLGAAALPWDVSVAYELDGKRVEAADLGGASGSLAVVITTKRNAAVDPAFFDNYLLQITVPFAAGKAVDVATEDGQIALAGSDTQVTFTGMPGKDGAFRATAQVSDFSSSGITFAAVPFSMGFETPDTSQLVSGFRQLGDGVGQLKIGADGVASGAGSLASGAGEVASGLDGLASGTGSLVEGANGLTAGAQGVAGGATGLLGGMQAYRQALLDQALGAQGKVDQAAAQAAQEAYAQAQAGYTQAFLGVYTPKYTQDYGVNISAGMTPEQAMKAAMQTAAVVAQSDAGVAAAQANLATTTQNLVAVNAANAAYGASSQALSGAATGLGETSDAQSLLGGAAALASGAGTLAEGTSSFASGASSLASGANQAASGAGQLAAGAGELASGAQQLASGTGQLYTEVQAMPDKVQQEIDAMLADYDKSDFTPVSFVSPKNTNVLLVQFVMSTDPIEAPKPPVEEAPAPEESFWTRLLALFGM